MENNKEYSKKGIYIVSKRLPDVPTLKISLELAKKIMTRIGEYDTYMEKSFANVYVTAPIKNPKVIDPESILSFYEDYPVTDFSKFTVIKSGGVDFFINKKDFSKYSTVVLVKELSDWVYDNLPKETLNDLLVKNGIDPFSIISIHREKLKEETIYTVFYRESVLTKGIEEENYRIESED